MKFFLLFGKITIMTEEPAPEKKDRQNEEETLDKNLRPERFSDFPGQEKLKDKLRVFLEAAQKRNEAMEHLLFYGPPGLGKTTLAQIMGNETGVEVRITSGPAIERPGELAAILTNLAPHDILFIDEIHRLSKVVEEVLYPAMEDFALDIVIGKGPSARSVRLELPNFTLIGATTRIGLMSSPLRDRFGALHRLRFYTEDELSEVVERSCSILALDIDKKGANEIAKRSRGTPRIANRLLKRVRDFAQVKKDGTVNYNVVKEALTLHGVDNRGLTREDCKFLKIICSKFNGGPVGVKTLSAALSEDEGTIEEVMEPYLIQCGFIKKTSRGRVATEKAFKHLGLVCPKKNGDQQKNLLE